MLSDSRIINYETILNKMSNDKFEALESNLNQMKIFGVKDFGYRSIIRTGESNIFSTSLKWHKINKNSEFYQHMSQHINSEILHVKQNNLQFFTRSDDKIYTPYLQCLDKHGVNNSVISLKFSSDKIELFYLMANSQYFNCRDIILNNLISLNSIISKMRPVFDFINESIEFKTQSKKILDENTIKLIWQDNARKLVRQGKFTRIIYNELEIFLSSQLLRCLLLLKLGWSNKSIALKLNISELTVKDHILTLKTKFKVQSRDYLTEIMQSEKMQYINRINEAML